MSAKETTTITVSTDFRDAIYNQKCPGESYEDVLRAHLPADLIETEQ